jgi:hypothetical protein
MSYWTMYWITRLDAVNGLMSAVAIIAAIGIVAGVIIYFIEQSELRSDLRRLNRAPHDDDYQAWVETDKLLLSLMMRCIKISIPCFIVSCIILTVIPTTKQAIAIWAVPKVINNEQVQALPDNALKLVNAQLQEWLKDVSGEVAREEPGK